MVTEPEVFCLIPLPVWTAFSITKNIDINENVMMFFDLLYIFCCYSIKPKCLFPHSRSPLKSSSLNMEWMFTHQQLWVSGCCRHTAVKENSNAQHIQVGVWLAVHCRGHWCVSTSRWGREGPGDNEIWAVVIPLTNRATCFKYQSITLRLYTNLSECTEHLLLF